MASPPRRSHPCEIHNALHDARALLSHFINHARERNDPVGARAYEQVRLELDHVMEINSDARSVQTWHPTEETIYSRVLSSVDQ